MRWPFTVAIGLVSSFKPQYESACFRRFGPLYGVGYLKTLLFSICTLSGQSGFVLDSVDVL